MLFPRRLCPYVCRIRTIEGGRVAAYEVSSRAAYFGRLGEKQSLGEADQLLIGPPTACSDNRDPITRERARILSETTLILAQVCSIIPAWLRSVRHFDISAGMKTIRNCAPDPFAHPPNSKICGQLTMQPTAKLQLPTKDFRIGGRPSRSACGLCFSETALWEPSGFGRCQIVALAC